MNENVLSISQVQEWINIEKSYISFLQSEKNDIMNLLDEFKNTTSEKQSSSIMCLGDLGLQSIVKDINVEVENSQKPFIDRIELLEKELDETKNLNSVIREKYQDIKHEYTYNIKKKEAILANIELEAESIGQRFANMLDEILGAIDQQFSIGTPIFEFENRLSSLLS